MDQRRCNKYMCLPHELKEKYDGRCERARIGWREQARYGEHYNKQIYTTNEDKLKCQLNICPLTARKLDLNQCLMLSKNTQPLTNETIGLLRCALQHYNTKSTTNHTQFLRGEILVYHIILFFFVYTLYNDFLALKGEFKTK